MQPTNTSRSIQNSLGVAMNPADILKKELNAHFHDTGFNVRLIPDENSYHFEVKYPAWRYHQTGCIGKMYTRREAIDLMLGFIVDDFSKKYKGKLHTHETNRTSTI